jgi:hypothetical protein
VGTDRAIGRVDYDSGALWLGLSEPSHGVNPSQPYVGPLVISEIMYHPITDSEWGEYLEITNRSGTEFVFGAGMEGDPLWRISGGVDFEFPNGLRLNPGAGLLVVGFDVSARPDRLEAFRQYYSVPSDVAVLGPFKGRLDNAGERLALSAQGNMMETLAGSMARPFVVEEWVEYDDSGYWPIGADGLGASLQRVSLAAAAAAPESWMASAATPGWLPGTTPDEDQDRDGMTDSWELAHGLDPTDAGDAALDGDGDGRSNLDEFRSGTDPWDPGALLDALAMEMTGEGFALHFEGTPGATYTILMKDHEGWHKLVNVTAPAEGGTITVVDPGSKNAPWRFYRVVGPAIP